ncbi:hypothetical protein PQX77_013829 [Marasmius sp. AFHP31]|nr:hypothetical protein PQX77_013829 [Marasmius sp. AFHP31]
MDDIVRPPSIVHDYLEFLATIAAWILEEGFLDRRIDKPGTQLASEVFCNSKVWYGAGVYTTSEAFRLAGISPFFTATEVFKNPSRLTRLILALYTFMNMAYDSKFRSLITTAMSGTVLAPTALQWENYAQFLDVAAVPRPRVDATQAHSVPPPLHPAFPIANPYDLALTAPDILQPCKVTRFPSGWPWKVEGWSATEVKENISAFTASVWNKKEGPKAVAILMGNNPNVYQPLIRADGTLIEEKQAMDSIRRVFRQETGITVNVFSASTANTPENYIPMFLVTNLTEDAITFYERLPIGVKTIVSFFIVPWNPPPSPYIFAFDNLHKLESTLENCRLVKEAVIRRWIELPNVRTFLTTKSDTSVPHVTEGLTEFLRQRMEVRAYDLEGKPVFNVYCRPPTVESYSKWMGIVRDNTPYIEYDIDGEVCVTKESRERRNFLGNGRKSGKGKGRFVVARCSWCTSVDHATRGCQPVNYDGWLGANANSVTVDTTGMEAGAGKRAPKKKDGRGPPNRPHNPVHK